MSAQAGIHEKGEISLNDIVDRIRKNEEFSKTGAIGLFIGVARGVDNEGQKVEKLTLEAYEEKANEVLEKICADLQGKQGIVNVQIHHLIGEFNVGEDMVYVSVAGSHRHEVLSVLREAVERYKNEVPVFKKEQIIDAHGTKRETWVSEKQYSQP